MGLSLNCVRMGCCLCNLFIHRCQPRTHSYGIVDGYVSERSGVGTPELPDTESLITLPPPVVPVSRGPGTWGLLDHLLHTKMTLEIDLTALVLPLPKVLSLTTWIAGMRASSTCRNAGRLEPQLEAEVGAVGDMGQGLPDFVRTPGWCLSCWLCCFCD